MFPCLATENKIKIFIMCCFFTFGSAFRLRLTFLFSAAVVVGFLPDSYRVSEAERVVTLSITKRTQATRRVSLQILTQDGSATSQQVFNSVIKYDTPCSQHQQTTLLS